MSKNKHLSLLIVLATGLLLTGCLASNPIKLADDKMDNRAKQFKPAKGKAGIYIFRIEAMTIGNGYLIPLTINGDALGYMKDSGFFWLEVEPGKYTIATGESKGSDDKVTIKARAGKNYFIRQTTESVPLVNIVYANLYKADEKVAKAKIAECRLLVSKLNTTKVSLK